MNEKELKRMLSFIVSNQVYILKRVQVVENKVSTSTKSSSDIIALRELERNFERNEQKVSEIIQKFSM